MSKPLAPGPKISIDAISMAPSASTGNNNVVLAFHALKSAKGKAGASLPPKISVGINGKSYDASDVTGAGTYVLYAKVAAEDVPSRPVFMRMSGGGIGPASPHGLKCQTVKCWKGCKSIIFGTECRVCIKCSFNL